jgi:hypothetical protein
MPHVSRSIGVALVAVVFVGCKKPGGAARTTPSASASSASGAKANPNVDAKLLGDLVELTKVCKVDATAGSLSCPQGEQRRLVSEFISDQRDRAKATATFAAALVDPKPELRAAAANVLYSAFRSPWGPNAKPGSVRGADADALLAAALELPKAQALQAIPAAVHAEMLANRGDALHAVLDKSGEAQVRTTALRYLMTHGRLAAFPKVQELAKSPELPVALAAFESPQGMYNWTQPEQAAICPWAAQFLGDPRAPIAAKAAALLSSCSGEYVDRLLEVGESALKAGDFSSARIGAFRDLCAPHRRAQPSPPSDEQCKRARKLLESVIKENKLPEQTRTTALAALAYQWPDSDTMKLATKLKSDSNKSLAEIASRTVARLEQRNRQASRTGSGPHAGDGKAAATTPAPPKRTAAAAPASNPPATPAPAAPPDEKPSDNPF